MANGQNGSSRWNGNYGAQEAQRRKNYDTGTKILGSIMRRPRDWESIQKSDAREALKTSDAVPRRKD